MENQINLSQFMDSLKANKAVMSTIPMGYVAGLPIVQIIGKKVCLVVPYFRFVRSGEPDKSQIHPIKYTVTALWPSGRIIKLEDLEYNPKFANVDFRRPIGLFRHEAIKQYNAGQYRQKKAELYAMYDKFVDFLQHGGEYTGQEQDGFRALLNIMLEPCLAPIYRALDEKFATMFLASKGCGQDG